MYLDWQARSLSHPLKFSAVLGRLDSRSHVRFAHDLGERRAGAVEIDEGVRGAREALRPLVVHLRGVFLHVQARNADLTFLAPAT